MAKDYGPSLKDDKQYEGGDTERDELSSRAAAIATHWTRQAKATSGLAPAAQQQSEPEEQRKRERRHPGPEQAAGRRGGKKVKLTPAGSGSRG